MIQKANYHCHTIFSDGQADPELYLINAIASGLEVFGFSDHAPIPGYPTSWNMPLEDLDTYIDSIHELKTKYRDRIDVLLSMEIDYIESMVHPLSESVKSSELDYTIGSVHFLRTGDSEEELWDFEAGENNTRYGIDRFFGGKVEDIIDQYFENIRKMISHFCPDIVGHLDRLKVINAYGSYIDEKSPFYIDQVEKTLKLIADSGAVMEVNTKGIYSRGYNEPYPSGWILSKAFDLGIPLVLSSDAHQPENIVGAFDYAYEMLKMIGYSKVENCGSIRCIK